VWIVAGILLGVVVLSSLAGFHTGPHTHLFAGICGAVAAVWLVAMALSGHSAPVVWTLFSADVVVSAGVAVMGWFGLTHAGRGSYPSTRLEGAEGVAVSDLVPEGIVRVRGEQWSATAVNGTVRAGTRVQVLGVSGVRLDVWGEKELVGGAAADTLSEGEPEEQKEAGA
jgi:membrane-bound ClpP family serine protease